MFRPTHDHDRGPRGHHRDPRWRPGPGASPFGFRAMFGREGWGGHRARRGEIRPLILAVLATRPMHGYEVIQELEARSGGRWRPSAGSVYPTLQLLADEGLVTSEEVDGRRVYRLTDQGKAAADAGPAPRPWDRDDRTSAEADLRRLGAQLMAAVVQVERMGSTGARQEATRILGDARRQLYRLLAEDEPAGAEEAEAGGAAEDGAESEPDERA